MNKDLFVQIVFGVWEYDTYFRCKKENNGLWCFSPVKKCMDAIHCLAYGASPDVADDDDLPHMSESTFFESV
jgi:hypothetical protein